MRSELDSRVTSRRVGAETLEMHTYRFRLRVLQAGQVLNVMVEPPGTIPLADVLPIIAEVQEVAGYNALLTGGWGVRLHAVSPRATSPDLDFIAQTATALTDLQEYYNLSVVDGWGSWVGFVTTTSGKRMRLEINTADFLPMGVWVDPDEISENQAPAVLVGSPLTIFSGKLARVFSRGPLERDQIDCAALLLSPHGELLVNQLTYQIALDHRVGLAMQALGLPQTVSNFFQPHEITRLTEYINRIGL